MLSTISTEKIWQAAESAMADYKAVVVRLHPTLGYLATGRYDSRSAAHRAQHTVQARNPESNVYVVIRGRGDDFVIYLDKNMVL